MKKEAFTIDIHKEIDGLNGVYKTIAQLTTLEDCLRIYQNFKGLSINFPTKLMDPEYVKEQLRKEQLSNRAFGKKEIQQAAVYYDYSERHIRRFLSELNQEDERVQEENISYISSWLQKQREKDDKEDE